MKKAVLNTTSTKKRDNMTPISNTTALGAPTPNILRNGAVVIKGGDPSSAAGAGVSGAIFVWSPTARPMNDNTNAENTRVKRDVYHKGFRERVKVESNSSHPWIWRRIVVETKTDDFNYFGESEDQPTLPPRAFQPYYQGGEGVSRLWYNHYGNRTGPTDTRIDSVLKTIADDLFEGTQNHDWLNTVTAKVDLDRYTLRYDKTRVFRSGNDAGFIKTVNFYHSFEKTMYYDHDEDRNGTNPQSWVCAPALKGMGNVYIIDIIESGISADDTDYLRITPESCAYWHER